MTRLPPGANLGHPANDIILDPEFLRILERELQKIPPEDHQPFLALLEHRARRDNDGIMLITIKEWRRQHHLPD